MVTEAYIRRKIDEHRNEPWEDETIRALIQEVERDTRHACAEAIGAAAVSIATICQQATMNASVE